MAGGNQGNKKETVRGAILKTLEEEGPLTSKALSQAVGVSDDDVVDHLKHLRQSGRHNHFKLKIIPAECRKCGFVFEKRERMSKPGKCPQCRDTYISEPEITVEEKSGKSGK